MAEKMTAKNLITIVRFRNGSATETNNGCIRYFLMEGSHVPLVSAVTP